MDRPNFTPLELQILDALWRRGACSIKEIQETFSGPSTPAYTTVQTAVYRLEKSDSLRCIKRIGNANIFEAAISKEETHRSLIDQLLALLGGRGKFVMAHLVDSGALTLEDLNDARLVLRKALKKGEGQ